MNRTLTRLARIAVDPARTADGRLLAGFLVGRDGTAFEALVRRHGPMVLAVCRRVLRHHQDAEDAFQATFLVLARRAADVWPRDAVGSWLYGVAYRVALKARTTRARHAGRERPLDESVHPPAAGPPPDPDLTDVLDRAIRTLPEVYRAAVVACDLEGRSRKEAAEQLGWAEGTLSGRLARARELLAARLRRAGLTLPAGGVAAVMSTGTSADAVPPELAGQVATFAALNTTAWVSAPVAALTEGVVRSMFLTKLQATAAAVLAAGVIGFGAWATAGAGDGPGEKPPAEVGKHLDQQKARLDALRKKLDEAERELDKETARAKAPDPATPAETKADLKPLQGRWRIDRISEGATTHLVGPKEPEAVVTISGNTLSMPYRDAEAGWRTVEYRFAVDTTKTPHTITLATPGKSIGQGVYEFPRVAGRAVLGLDGLPAKLRLAVATGAKPAAFGAKLDVIEFDLTRVTDKEPAPGERSKLDATTLKAVRQHADEAAVVVDSARREFALAQARAEEAEVGAAVASARLKDAEAKLAAARKRAEEVEHSLRGGAGGGRTVEPQTYTLLIRGLTAPEQVVTQAVKPDLTVADALAGAGDTLAKATGAAKPGDVSVWVVRDKALLPVDLEGIMRERDHMTNYRLRAGDQVFVQVKPAK